MPTRFFLSLLILIGTAGVSRAGLLNFEGMPASTNLAGTPNNPASVLTTQLNTSGIVFGLAGVSTGVAVINNSAGASSNPNAISGLDASGNLTNAVAGNIYFSFVAPNTLTPSTTNFVSFEVGDDGGDIDSFTIRAFNLSNTLINTQNLSGAAFQLYSLSLAGINRIEVLNTTGSTLGYGVDDLFFNEPAAVAAVPEPSSLAFLTTTIGILVARRKRVGSSPRKFEGSLE